MSMRQDDDVQGECPNVDHDIASVAPQSSISKEPETATDAINVVSPSCDNYCSEGETIVEPVLTGIETQDDCCVAFLFGGPDDESLDQEEDEMEHAMAEQWKRIAKCMDDVEDINEQAEDIKKGIDELTQSQM